jgi:putative transposase
MRSPNAGSGDAGASSWTAPLSGTRAHLRQVLRQYETHHNQHRPHRFLHGAAPLKRLPKPVDLDLYRVRRQAQVGGMINGYRLVA